MRTTSHIIGYSNQGEGAELRAKQKSACEKLREYQKMKEEAAANGEKAKFDVLRDDRRESPENIIKPNGTTTPPLTTKDVFSLTAVKKRKVEAPEEGEIQSPKKAKIGTYSDRALKPKPASAQMQAKPSYKRAAKPQEDRKVGPYKGTARPQVDRKVIPYKGTARPPDDMKRACQTGPVGPSLGLRKPYTGTTKPLTQIEPGSKLGSSTPVQDSKVDDPKKSLKRKAEEEPTGASDAKVHKTVQRARTAPPIKPGKASGKKRSDQKPFDRKPTDQKRSLQKPSDNKTSGKENTLREEAQDQGEEKKRRGRKDSDKSSAKKRTAVDEAEGQTKKIKSGEGFEKSTQPSAGPTSTNPPPSLAAPKGLENFGMACFANSVLQCLANIPEFADFYRAKANDTVKTEPGCVLTEDQRKGFERKAKGQTRTQLGKRDDLRKAFKKVKNSVRVQAYLGELFERMHAVESTASSVSPIDFLYALGLLVEDDNGYPLDGEMQTDAWEFYYGLLHQLQYEEMNSRDSHKDPTTVENLLGSSSVDVLSCSLCGHSHESPQTAGLSLDLALPRVDKREEVSLTQCLDDFVKGTAVEDYKCDGCGKLGGVIKSARIKHAAKYLVIKLTRTDNKGKIDTHVPCPTSIMDLGSYFADSDTEDHHRYEVMGVAQHIGRSFKEGHWLATKKVHDRWWMCSDIHVLSLETEEVAQQNRGSLFFLKKVE